jgi:hypothetical protein
LNEKKKETDIKNDVQTNNMFSWKIMKQQAIDIKIRRAKTMAKSDCNPDFSVKHPDWCRDAKKGNYKDLEKKITEQTLKAQDKYAKRNEVIHARRK